MSASEQRKMQEEAENFLTGGYYKSITKAHKAIFDDYVKLGFTRDEALKLLIMLFTPKT